MKKVSIIIPVYNEEKHIKKCLEEIIKQTYKKIEIIVLNDGSTDETMTILDNYFCNDKKIKIINKDNTGVSDTRNLGIEKASGDYILFLDSDDFLEKNAIENMMNKIDNQAIDMLIFGFKVLGSNNRLNDTNMLKKLVHSRELKSDLISSVISTKNNIYGYIWRAMYSKKLLKENNILFPKGIKIYEDYMFFLNTIYHSCSKNIIVDFNEYYIYNINESSMSIKHIPTLLNDMLFVNNWLYKNIVIKNKNLIVGYECCMCNTYLRFVQNVIRNDKIKFREKYKYIMQKKKEHKFNKYLSKVGYRYKEFDLKTFFSLLFFQFNLDYIYALLFEIKNKISG